MSKDKPVASIRTQPIRNKEVCLLHKPDTDLIIHFLQSVFLCHRIIGSFVVYDLALHALIQPFQPGIDLFQSRIKNQPIV